MERLTSSSSTLGGVKIRGIVEADEFYIKAGLKGRPYHLEILNAGRLPRSRGLKPWRERGTYEKEHPMITCIHQRGRMTYFNVSTKHSLISNIRRPVDPHSKVFTDEYLGYRNLKQYGFVHKQVCHSHQKEYARGMVHVNNCECIEATFTRYGYDLNKDLDQKDHIYLVSPQFVEEKINKIMNILVDIGFTCRLGLFSRLREG